MSGRASAKVRETEKDVIVTMERDSIGKKVNIAKEGVWSALLTRLHSPPKGGLAPATSPCLSLVLPGGCLLAYPIIPLTPSKVNPLFSFSPSSESNFRGMCK